MSTSSWSGRKVLVTGGEGFIGSTLVDHLLGLGAEVRAYVHYKPYGSAGYLAGREDDVDIVAGDVRDGERVSEAVRGLRHRLPSRRADRHPLQLRRSRELRPDQRGRHLQRRQRLPQRTTCDGWCTPRRARPTALRVTAPISEEHPLQPQSPYSASKIGADMMALSFIALVRLAGRGDPARSTPTARGSRRAPSSRRSSRSCTPARRRSSSVRPARPATSTTSTTPPRASSRWPRATARSATSSTSALAARSRSATLAELLVKVSGQDAKVVDRRHPGPARQQ